MKFDNLDDLFRYIEKQTKDVMKKEVADEAKQAMSEAVQASVYDAYVPKYYTRRGKNGGLADTDNYDVYEIPNGIEVVNNTPPDNGSSVDLDDIICNGLGQQPFPRDFYKEAIDILNRSDDLRAALKEGLKTRGINAD